MKLKYILVVLLFLANLKIGYTQSSIKMTAKYGVENEELMQIIDFQDIYLEKLSFDGQDLKGKYVEINIQEYKKGKLVAKKNLFDASEDEYFRIDSTSTYIKFFCSMNDETLKTFIRGKQYGSRKENFALQKGNGEYILKDFLGNKKFLDVPVNEEFAIFAILTPKLNEDGSSSYCEVVQSDIKPEELGSHFKIPHYFLITMKFK